MSKKYFRNSFEIFHLTQVSRGAWMKIYDVGATIPEDLERQVDLKNGGKNK